jgi:hypothetical protein
MKKLWPVIYAILIPIVIISGYRALSQEATAGTNVDWIFVTVAFVGLVAFSLGSVTYGFRYSKKEKMKRPTWDRHPIGWWTDTLQSLRFCWVSMALYAFGALFAFRRADEKGRMMFFFLVAMPAGLFVGERLVYAIYGKKIGA